MPPSQAESFLRPNALKPAVTSEPAPGPSLGPNPPTPPEVQPVSLPGTCHQLFLSPEPRFPPIGPQRLCGGGGQLFLALVAPEEGTSLFIPFCLFFFRRTFPPPPRPSPCSLRPLVTTNFITTSTPWSITAPLEVFSSCIWTISLDPPYLLCIYIFFCPRPCFTSKSERDNLLPSQMLGAPKAEKLLFPGNYDNLTFGLFIIPHKRIPR